jgi:hypothetical protein
MEMIISVCHMFSGYVNTRLRSLQIAISRQRSCVNSSSIPEVFIDTPDDLFRENQFHNIESVIMK